MTRWAASSAIHWAIRRLAAGRAGRFVTVVSFRIISIGTLAAHPLWDERSPVRTGHATTTLISAPGGVRILVNPSLPAPALAARLHERSGLTPRDITHVFLSSFDADHARGLAGFDNAQWLASETELAFASQRHGELAVEAGEHGSAGAIGPAEAAIRLLRRCQNAPDRLTPGVDLFPMPGVTGGLAGLLLPQPRGTVLICGDAVATTEHLLQRKVLPGCWDVQQAMDSFNEAIEIADVLIPGRDNVVINPHR